MDVFCVSSFFVFTPQIEFSECCVWFQWFTQWCCTCVSNLVPCWWEEKRKNELLMDVFCVSSFFCLNYPDWVSWVLYLISMIHSMMLFLCLQYRCLLTRREIGKEWIVDGCLLCVFFPFVFTSQIEFSECCVWFQWFTQWCCSCVSNLVACLYEEKEKRVICWWMSFVCLLSFVFTSQIEFGECCVWFQWFTQWCCSCVPYIVPCWRKEKMKRGWIVDGCLLCVFSLLSLPHIFSWVSAVFDFNDSLNDVAPLSPIVLSVDTKRNGKEWIADGCHLCVFFCLHPTYRVQWVLCLISVLHSMILLLFLLSCCLLMWKEMKRVICWWMSFVSSLFCIHDSDRVQWVLCLISMLHSVMLPPHFQLHSLVLHIFQMYLLLQQRKRMIVDGCLLCVFFLLSSQLRLSFVSVVFDFNDSLSDFTPVYSMLFPVVEKRRVSCW